MKKIGLLVAILAVVVFAAEQDVWYEYPPCSGTWVHMTPGDPTNLARLWCQYPTGGACNRQYYSFTFTTGVSMAQWVEWSISATEWKWKVRKVGPDLCQTDGWYAGDCITAWIKSNYDVEITFSGFDDLYNPNSVDKWIEAWYAWGEFMTPPPKNDPLWVRAPDLNNVTIRYPDSDTLHAGISVKIWTMIHVTSCNSACEYSDEGTVTIELKCIKPWIDPLTGYFNI
ncbi:MAG: hypothetical protein ABIK93_06945 [candidate division WOR-3 bacterium]